MRSQSRQSDIPYGMLLGRCMIAPESQIALEKAIALDRNYAAAMLQLGYTLYGRNKSTLIPSELTTGFPLVQTLIPSQTRVRCRAKPEAPDLRQELPLRARKRSLQRP